MDVIITAYFQIFPQEYFLLLISFGISAIIIYGLFSFFDD